ncbi:importin-alpha export receptor, partial [Ceratobasidium sp. 370]
MKCVMHVIITARQTLTPNFVTILAKLVGILRIISSNPSNPNFNQYCFESVSALIRLWSQILTHVLLPEVPRTLAHNNRLVSVGLARMLVHSQRRVQPPSANAWPRTLEAVIALFGLPTLTKSKDKVQTSDDAVTTIDYEEQGAGLRIAKAKDAPWARCWISSWTNGTRR